MTVESRTTLDGSVLPDGQPNFETYPIAAIIYYEFPAQATCPRAHDLVRRWSHAASTQ